MQDQEVIIITAARPGLWFKERFTPSGISRWLSEKFVKDYGSTVEKLREIDDAIYEWVLDIENLSKELNSKVRRPGVMTDNKVVDFAVLLGAINKRFKKINEARDVLEKSNEKYLEQFEDEIDVHIPSDSIYDLHDRDKRIIQEMQATDDGEGLETTAGMWEDLKKKWVSKKMENKFLKNRREKVLELVRNSDKLVKHLKDKLKSLEKARSSGDVGEYVNTLMEIGKRQQEFENQFVKVYTEHMKGPIEAMMAERGQSFESETAEEVPQTKMAPEITPEVVPEIEVSSPAEPVQEVPFAPELDLPPAPIEPEPEIPSPEPESAPEPEVVTETVQKPKAKSRAKSKAKPKPKAEPKAKTESKPKAKRKPRAKASPTPPSPIIPPSKEEVKESFLRTLDTLMKEGDAVTAALLISKYSEEIEDDDPNLSARLLVTAANLLSDE